MLAPERREKILQEVRRNKSVLVKDLCVRFQVTGETIRKDLAQLEKEGKLLKTHGGAYIQEGVQNEIHAKLRQTLYTDIKKAIGRVCAATVRSGETVFLDESTTSFYIAEELLKLERLTVLTNSLQIINAVADNPEIQAILFGGQFSHRNLCFTGSDAMSMLSKYYADCAFVSCRGLDMQNGITDGAREGGEIRRRMLEHAGRRTLVADSTKFGKTHLYHIADFELVDTVVADFFPEGWETFFADRNIYAVQTERQGKDEL